MPVHNSLDKIMPTATIQEDSSLMAIKVVSCEFTSHVREGGERGGVEVQSISLTINMLNSTGRL